MPKGDASRWHNSVYSITWAKVEFLVWRDGCTKSRAFERLAYHGIPFTLTRGRKPHEPMYSVEWIDGEKIEHYPRGEEWEYDPSQGKGAHREAFNLRQLYYKARCKRESDDEVRKNADLFLAMLKDDYAGGFLGGILDSAEIMPPPEK